MKFGTFSRKSKGGIKGKSRCVCQRLYENNLAKIQKKLVSLSIKIVFVTSDFIETMICTFKITQNI